MTLELVFLLIGLLALAFWKTDPWLQIIVGLGVFWIGLQWYPVYPMLGIVVMMLAGYCGYRCIRYFTG